LVTTFKYVKTASFPFIIYKHPTIRRCIAYAVKKASLNKLKVNYLCRSRHWCNISPSYTIRCDVAMCPNFSTSTAKCKWLCISIQHSEKLLDLCCT